MLISKIFFKNKINIILIYFQIKNILKINHKYISKQNFKNTDTYMLKNFVWELKTLYNIGKKGIKTHSKL